MVDDFVDPASDYTLQMEVAVGRIAEPKSANVEPAENNRNDENGWM